MNQRFVAFFLVLRSVGKDIKMFPGFFSRNFFCVSEMLTPGKYNGGQLYIHYEIQTL